MKLLTELKQEINSNTIIIDDFNTALSTMDRLSRDRINKDMANLNKTIEQMVWNDIYRTFHEIISENTFYSRATFSRTDHM